MKSFKKVFLVLFVVLLIVGLRVQNALATYSQIVCGGGVCTMITSEDLKDGQTGINPAQTINLSFYAVKAGADSTPTADPIQCGAPNSLYNAVRHYIAGDISNYEYISPGSGAFINFQFNSGVDQQDNKYVGVFYCDNQLRGTSKTEIDYILSLAGRATQTPMFNLKTRATTIDPVCSQITDCSKYPVINDCTGNRCKLSPPCQWKNNACVKSAVATSVAPVSGTTGGYSFNLENPIGVSDFQDLINIIGRWIFNLAIPIAVIMIIWGGVQMLTAGVYPKQFDKGKETVKWAVIGLAVVLIGKGFVTLVMSILSLGKK